MQFFIDSSKLSEIDEINKTGILGGITTNPSLLKDALAQGLINSLIGIADNVNMHKINLSKGDGIEDYIIGILDAAGRIPVSLQVTGKNPYFTELYDEGILLYEKFNTINNNVVIKIPINPAYKNIKEYAFYGLKAIRDLSNKNIPVNTTLIMKPSQAVLAAYAGANYVSPFVGRIDDYLRESMLNISFNKLDYYPAKGKHIDEYIINDNGVVSGVNLVEKIIEEFDKRNLRNNTKILAASVRNVKQVEELWSVGSDIASLPYNVFKEALDEYLPNLISHPKTYEGARKFVDDVPESYSSLIYN